MNLGELAATATLASVATLILSGITGALFFAGAGSFWGPINDLFAAATVLLLIPAILAVHRLAGADAAGWLGPITALAIAGVAVVAVGQVLLVAGALSLHGSFLTGGIGVLPILAWLAAVALLALTGAALSPTVGLLIVGALVGAGLMTISALALPMPVTVVVGVALLALLSAALLALAGDVRPAI